MGADQRSSPITGFGPFYRTGSAQSDETTSQQVATGQIGGGIDRGSFFPSVDAWIGELPPTKPGVEFYTHVVPDRGSPPGKARWSGQRAGVMVVGDTAMIEATITRHRFRS